MSKVVVPDSVKDKLPKEFHELEVDCDYRLTKTGSKRDNIFVWQGDKVRGRLQIVDVAELGLPGIKVVQSMNDYIRTSPIVKITDVTENSIAFETEGGFYLLEKLLDN